MPPASPVVMSADEIMSYGTSSTISATVSGGVGTMQFYVDGTNFGAPVTLSSGSAALPSTATVPAGNHTVMGVYSNAITHLLTTANDEALLTITPISVGVSGTRAYDGTTNVDTGILSFTGNLDGGNLTLIGSGYLTNGKCRNTTAVHWIKVSRPGERFNGRFDCERDPCVHLDSRRAPAGERQYVDRGHQCPWLWSSGGDGHHADRSNVGAGRLFGKPRLLPN